mgnify:CR=1 FL=1|tara:strand:+ start:1159 stop:1389 length:231 start_codon:yes stop_codon:yes gene_type:complete
MSEGVKPIQRVEDTLLDIHKKLDNIKVDVGCIKSDLKIILNKLQAQAEQQRQQQRDELKNQVQHQEEISKAWFFTY